MYILSRGEVPGHPRWLRFARHDRWGARHDRWGARHDRWGARHDTNNPSLRTERSVVKQSLVLGVASLTLAMTNIRTNILSF
jgi:hypothetical protein